MNIVSLNQLTMRRVLVQKKSRIAVVGLGYVGLPVALNFSRSGYPVIGYDLNLARVEALQSGIDKNLDQSVDHLNTASCADIEFTSDKMRLDHCDVYIIAVPTPVDDLKQPQLDSLKLASETVANVLREGRIVIYESTVYPGATDEVCINILEELSGLRCIRDNVAGQFGVGYSPERINPGDTEHTFTNISKVVSGSSKAIAKQIAELYGSVIEADVHIAPSIEVAELAKVLENTQRDVNIALVNEVAICCDNLGIDTLDVLEAAGTKWNFLNFRPGLVGGHCIGVDPYYLAFRMKQRGVEPKVTLAGREVNESVVDFLINKLDRELKKIKRSKVPIHVGILGLTFKEDVADFRNSKVELLVERLVDQGCQVVLSDVFSSSCANGMFAGMEIISRDKFGDLDVLILSVPHGDYLDISLDYFKRIFRTDGPKIFIDVKGVYRNNTELDNICTRFNL